VHLILQTSHLYFCNNIRNGQRSRGGDERREAAAVLAPTTILTLYRDA